MLLQKHGYTLSLSSNDSSNRREEIRNQLISLLVILQLDTQTHAHNANRNMQMEAEWVGVWRMLRPVVFFFSGVRADRLMMILR